MKSIYTIVATAALSGMILLNSCDSKKEEKKTAVVQTNKNEINIPAWQDRQSNVGDLRESGKMYETYLSISDQIKANPEDYGSRLKMADLFIVEARATGNYGYYYPAAVQMIDGVLADNPKKKDDLFRAYTSKAVILLSLHKFAEAKEMGEKAMAINSHNSRVFGILTDANVELGNYKEAVVMADSMNAIRPDLRSYSRISYLREIYGDVEGAKEAMQMAVKAGSPGHEETSWAQVTLGNLYENYGDLKSAEELYRLALYERQNYPFAIQGLASVKLKQNQPDSAMAMLEKAIKLRPEPAFYEDLAVVYQQTGNQEAFKQASNKAFAALRGLSENKTPNNKHGHEHKHEDGKAHKHNHEHPEHTHASADHSGEDHQHGHDHKHHEHEHGEAMHSHNDEHSHSDRSENNAHGHSHETGLEMANLYLKLTDNSEEALHHVLHEYAIRPGNIEVNTALAKAYYQQQKYDLAAEHFQKAMATGSKNPDIMIIGGLIMMKQGKKAEGKKLINQAMKADPYVKSKYVNEAKSMMIRF